MPVEFYWLAGIHALYILIFHSLVSFLPHYIYTEYEATPVDAGYIASVPYAVVSVATLINYLYFHIVFLYKLVAVYGLTSV